VPLPHPIRLARTEQPALDPGRDEVLGVPLREREPITEDETVPVHVRGAGGGPGGVRHCGR